MRVLGGGLQIEKRKGFLRVPNQNGVSREVTRFPPLEAAEPPGVFTRI